MLTRACNEDAFISFLHEVYTNFFVVILPFKHFRSRSFALRELFCFSTTTSLPPNTYTHTHTHTYTHTHTHTHTHSSPRPYFSNGPPITRHFFYLGSNATKPRQTFYIGHSRYSQPLQVSYWENRKYHCCEYVKRQCRVSSLPQGKNHLTALCLYYDDSNSPCIRTYGHPNRFLY